MIQRVLTGLLALASSASALQGMPMSIGQLRRQAEAKLQQRDLITRDLTYEDHYLQVPVDHFHNETKYEPHSDETFGLRYWFDDQFYKPGGPVFVLSAGETDGEDRFPFLEKGIIYEVTKAVGGLGVILEHRYYGKSYPTPDFSTENLRFLTTDQALADTAYFAKNVVFPGHEDVDWSPEATPWIAYGGSYAGAFVAFLRIAYPDVYFGAISSSGVPEAIWDFWEYFEAARVYAPEGCADVTGKVINVVDRILLNESLAEYVPQLKEVFSLGSVTDNKDFASSISSGIYNLQGWNWDPAIADDSFFTYCDTVVNTTNQFPQAESKRASVEELIDVAGWGDEPDLVDRFLNYIGTLGRFVESCDGDQDDCFGTTNAEAYDGDDLSNTWKLWPYQYCDEWGYLQTGSGAPDDILPMISRAVDLEYSARICVQTFGRTAPANVSNVNKWGGFDASYHRLAWVDGEWDPWRAAGVHALSQPPRESTVSEPYILIDKAVHHWDENGLFCNETRPGVPPEAVKSAKKEIRAFVREWLKDWVPKK